MKFTTVILLLNLVRTTICIAPNAEMENIFKMLENEIRKKRLKLEAKQIPTKLPTVNVDGLINPRYQHDPTYRQWVWKMSSNQCHKKLEKRTIHRKKRDAQIVSSPLKWPRTILSYRVHNHPPSLTRLQTRHVMNRSFRIWSKRSSLEFYEKETGPADINLRFESGSHGDGDNNAFDGPGGHLAHAHAPPIGEVHFDAEEKWGRRSTTKRHIVVTSETGKRSIEVQVYYNLVLAAVHEIGHALGLKHIEKEDSVMYPLYSERSRQKRIRLHASDVQALQSLYGSPSLLVSRNVTPIYGSQRPLPLYNIGDVKIKKKWKPPDLCSTTLNAVYSSRGLIHFFKNRYYWTWEEKTGRFSEPVKLKKIFDLSKPRVDAACHSEFSDRTYIFSGQKYWRFFNQTLEGRFPQLSRNHKIPSKPDAAIHIPGTPTIVIIKNQKFYLFDELDETASDRQSLKSLRFLPPKFYPLDGALAHGQHAYFFVGNKTLGVPKARLEEIFLKKEKVIISSKVQKPWISACIFPEME